MREVDRMPYSVFNRSLKACIMLSAQEGIATIQQTNFHTFEERERNKIIGALKDHADKYVFRPMLDYKDVVANLARKMRGG